MTEVSVKPWIGTAQIPQTSPTGRWVVHWRYRTTNKSGHGSPVSKAIAESAVIMANRQHKEIFHWIEPERVSPPE